MPSLTNNKEQASNSSHKVEAEYLNWECNDCKGKTDDQDHKANEVCGSCCSPPSLKRKQERHYTQQCTELSHCRSLVSFNHFLLKSFTVRRVPYAKAILDASKTHSFRAETPPLVSQHRTPSLLTCPGEKRDIVQHGYRGNTSRLPICKRLTSEQTGHTTTKNVLYCYHSCSTCKFPKPLPCMGKYESRWGLLPPEMTAVK